MATKKTTAKKPTTAKTTTRKGAETKTKPAASSKPERLSAIDAAAKVLGTSKEPMNSKELIEAMASKKLWSSPAGKTPHATLYSAILREINSKGKESRFKKADRGQFVANA